MGTQAPVTEASPPPAQPSGGRVARWVILGALAIGTLIGTWVYFSATRASITVWDQIETFTTRGRTLSGPDCVGASLDWFRDTCSAPGRICLDAVPRAVSHCLAAGDRTADCTALGNNEKPSQWAYERCAERGIDRKARKPIKESCTSAWRAFDTFCKSGQRGVAL
jgi:hypothetical protein